MWVGFFFYIMLIYRCIDVLIYVCNDVDMLWVIFVVNIKGGVGKMIMVVYLVMVLFC